MKKPFKTAMTLLLAALMFFSMSVCAFADSLVVYGPGRAFSVLPDADLFDGFKAIMPGDMRSESITVRNDYTGSTYVYIFVQALPHNPSEGAHDPDVSSSESYSSMMDFLSQLTLTVRQDGNIISLDTADQPAGLAGRHLIGAFRGRGQSTIEVTLSVPITMGNEYAGRMSEIDWVFTAEEWNEPVGIKTGDDAQPALWLTLILLSVLAAACVLFLLRRRKIRG